jgi:superfamily II DNA or RNA helicase
VLRPLELIEVTGMRLEHLPLARRFRQSDLGVLMTDALPAIEAKLQVAIESKRLPARGRERIAPRISFEIGSDAHALSVLPLVVYGDPPRARVDAGRMVHLEGTLPERDETAERRLIERLRDELNLVPGRRVGFDGQEANRFASRLRQFQQSLGDRAGESFVRSAPLVPRVAVDGELLSVEFLSPDGKSAEPAAGAETVLRAWKEGLSLVPLADGGWAPLPLDWLSRYGDQILDLLGARDAEGRVSRSAVFALARLCDDLEQPRPPSFAALEPLVRDFQRIPAAKLPADLAATLRDYQRAGVDWLCFLRDAGLGAVLADDMGLGKTVQTLCAVSGRVLVVCPKSVLFNWQNEARRFRPALGVALYHGPDRTLDAGADLTLTTYAVLRLDAERLAQEHWDAVVLDEAQAIKNPDSQVARAAFGLNAKFRAALSGTPLENRLEELWSVFHFTNRGLLGGRSEFRDRYALPAEQGDAAKLAALREKTRPFVLRRLKRDVVPELPPRTETTLEIELEPSERDLYSAVHAATRREVLERLEREKNVISALEALLRLRQAACHPALLPGQTAQTSSKVVALVEALEQVAAEGHKALVFSQWTSLLDLVEPHLGAAGIPFTRLDGSTRDRQAVVDTFQASSGPPVLLASLKAGGTGLNLTAADHVFLLDPWWNPSVEYQAADRAHRIGQERPVFVYRLVARDTVEQGILALQVKKRALAEAALDAGQTAGRITREDLLALLA